MNYIKIKILLTIFILSGFVNIQAQEVTVPIETQVDLLTKILSLNKSLNLGNNDISVGILYSSALRTSLRVKEDIVLQAEGRELRIKKSKLNLVPLDVNNVNNLNDFFEENLVDVLYITPLRGYDISEITKICKEKKIVTFTGVSSFISDNNVSVGIELQNNKLQITINLESAKAEGANFSSRLLSVSQIK